MEIEKVSRARSGGDQNQRPRERTFNSWITWSEQWSCNVIFYLLFKAQPYKGADAPFREIAISVQGCLLHKMLSLEDSKRILCKTLVFSFD